MDGGGAWPEPPRRHASETTPGRDAGSHAPPCCCLLMCLLLLVHCVPERDPLRRREIAEACRGEACFPIPDALDAWLRVGQLMIAVKGGSKLMLSDGCSQSFLS